MGTTPLDALNDATSHDFVAALADIYEHAPWVAAAAAAARPFAGIAALHAALAAAVDAAPEAQRLVLVRNHPDLAGRAARAGEVTAHSAAEQAGAGLDRLSDAECESFHRLNDAYRAKFGFPFIVCVGRHTKDSILRQFERRLANAPAAELATALAEVSRIAALRLDRLVDGPDRLKVAGRLSTHVLDTHAGRPAAGVAIELVEIAAAGPSRLLARATTNADGRTDAPLIAGRPVPIGTYELRFAIGAYFAAQVVAGGEPRFLDIVPIRFSVAEPEGHYHVPLLATPWSYTTYRGS